ncbi:mucosa-associated lymphoid tissue lymphoma translocation protein 1 isoform X2 [Entelurus aequoreus]|nr:mucosa-associated lymphoid tissue lymphoma translocation protein 1 isoform X2 [Entelurus aequoreus]
MCSLKVLHPDGSPSRTLLRLMGERGCTRGHLLDYLQTLGNAEALQCLKAPALQVLIQPQSVALVCGHNLRLCCHAVGQSPVQYQWFKSKEEVPNGSAPDLVIAPVDVKDSGFYVCRVNCGDSFEFSQWAQVDVLDVSVPCGQSSEGRLKVAIQPQSQMLHAGQTLQLECGAVGRPIPRYQWHRNGVPVANAKRRKLTIPHVTHDNQGGYRCEIMSGAERTWSKEVQVVIDMGQFDATKGKQALEIRSSLSERRALNDPVQPSDTDQVHSLQWAKAHELPESMSLDFECGAQIKLGFAAEFSNVLVIYTHIIKKPAELSSCQAHVTDFPQELDVDPKEMNRETPEETGVYLLSSSLPQHCLYTRLGSLQKLKEELEFTVYLRGTSPAMDDDDVVCWTKKVNIGKPLIARLDLHEATRQNSCLHTCLMPHSPGQSPATVHRTHQHPKEHPAGLPSPQCHHLHVPAVGGVEHGHGNTGCSKVARSTSMPIEASDDMDELQTAFINSLQLQQS